MRKTLCTGIILLMLGLNVAAQPEGEWAGPLDKRELAEAADRVMQELLNKGELDASWQQAPLQGVTLREAAARKVWVASYRHPAKADQEAWLFILLNERGELLGVNRDGSLLDLASPTTEAE